ncbi:MAG: aminoacyl-tRNA deacylase [Gemmatimonadetes bacterium]|jgi:Cys-tRNA(Pro) deacylase|nr:aminoacyl-tRNA deacylase [Gemmatimonadota bacterium]
MAKVKIPVTRATRALRQGKVDFTDHLYDYEERGGTTRASRELGIDHHSTVKTLIMEDDGKKPLVVLMHGDLDVSTKNLARHIGVKTVSPCTPEVAQRHTGYMVGGTSPFGTRKPLPVYMEKSILGLPRVYINGGKRGYLVGMIPAEIQRLLQPTLVEVGIPPEDRQPA